MVLVEDLAGMGDIQVIGRGFGPGQGDQPVEIGADDAVLGRGSGQAGQTFQLAFGLFLGLLGHFGVFDLLAEFLRLDRLLVLLAELLLDGFHLLAQEVFALDLFDLAAGFVLDLLAKLQHFRFADQQADQLLQLVGDRIELQDLLRVLDVHALEVGDGIGRLERVFDRGDRAGQLLGKEGIICVICWNWSRALRARASISMPSSMTSGASSMWALRYGSSWTNSPRRKRSMPCTSRRMVPSGARNSRWTMAIVPTL